MEGKTNGQLTSSNLTAAANKRIGAANTKKEKKKKKTSEKQLIWRATLADDAECDSKSWQAASTNNLRGHVYRRLDRRSLETARKAAYVDESKGDFGETTRQAALQYGLTEKLSRRHKYIRF